MARGKLDDKTVRGLMPSSSNKITYDSEVRGFGVCVTKAGAKSFIINYSIAGRERRYTIGSYPAWSVAGARDEAKRLRQDIDRGEDPLASREESRVAATVTDLCTKYLEEHAVKKRPSSDDAAMIERRIKPRFGARKVASIRYDDIDALHREVTKEGHPYAANRLIALLSKMFALAIRWGMRADNPAKGIERNTEERRYRYLTGDELGRLTAALSTHPNQGAANAVRLLLLTGARRGEVLGATWDQFDLAGGVWTKPSSHTKQKREHRVPLSAPVRQLLSEMRAAAEPQPSLYLFPSRSGKGPVGDIKSSWATLCKAADIRGVRPHDLRHTYASLLASAGLSLPVIGALLGHTQAATTSRYMHLFDDLLRAATERVAALVLPDKVERAEPIPLHPRR